MYRFVSQLNYDLIFMAQGIVDQIYWKEMTKSRQELSQTMWSIAMVFGFWFMHSMTSPTNVTDQGYLFFYPIYPVTTLQSLHTTGTFMWLYIVNWQMEMTANSKFSEYWYDLIIGSSLYLYITHYFWLAIICKLITWNCNFSFTGNVFFNLILTEIVVVLTYLGLKKLIKLCKKKCGNKTEP